MVTAKVERGVERGWMAWHPKYGYSGPLFQRKIDCDFCIDLSGGYRSKHIERTSTIRPITKKKKM